MQIHFSFSATSLWGDLSFCWKTELGCQVKAWKSLIYRQELLFLYRKELLFLSTAGSFPKLHGILFQSKEGKGKTRTYTWQILTGAPEILKPGSMSQSSSHVVILAFLVPSSTTSFKVFSTCFLCFLETFLKKVTNCITWTLPLRWFMKSKVFLRRAKLQLRGYHQHFPPHFRAVQVPSYAWHHRELLLYTHLSSGCTAGGNG